MEVEMRMLETKSSDCFCAYCSGAAMSPKDDSTCPIAIELLESAGQNMVAQQLDLSSSAQNGSYALKFTTKYHESIASTDIDVEGDKNAGVLTAPFLACKIAASYTLLRDFKLFMAQANTQMLMMVMVMAMISPCRPEEIPG
ncbi:hypothetical protein QTG54_004318 [Skeletonema marinoi]|uniref:Uncharacterized protein n=1 Tax=Skeletonema marinoi TaxID=267567 RepID=A0AAD8YGI9_9STRA|nr:hypothetical protein QTG54_004318 [Skeletonema marinoi]